MKIIIKKAIAVVLTIVITGTSNGIGSLCEVRAESSNSQTNEQLFLTETLNNELETVKELKSKRTENSNTYLMSDGSKQLEIYYEDIRFDQNGELVDYDSSLVSNTKNVTVGTDTLSKNDYAYVNKAGDCKHYIPESLDEDTPIVLTKDNTYIKFFPIIESEEMEYETETEAAADTSPDNLSLSDATLTDDGNIEYSVGDVTYQYISNTKGIKENVIFNSEPTEYDISYSFDLNNRYLKYSADTRQIFIKDSSNDDIVAYISAPFLNDSSEMNFNFDIETRVEEVDGKWIVTYSLPRNYFEDDATSYPVVLDPTIGWSTASNIDIRYTLNVGGSGGSVMDSSNHFMIANLDNGSGTGTDGYAAQANVRYKNLNEIIKGKYISYAYCNFYEESKSGTPLLSVYPIIEDWNYLTTTWHSRPDISSESISDIDMTIDNGYLSLWLTDWVRKLSSGEIDNDYGIAFYPQENSNVFWLYFYGLSAPNGPDGTVRTPVLVINYDDGENISASYDGSFTINAEYNSEDEEIDLSWDIYNSDVDRYDLYVREDDDVHFKYAGCTTTNEFSYDTDTDIENYDFRVVAVESGSYAPYGPYDTQHLSNILTFEKDEFIYHDQNENEQTDISYESVVMDTDGDELEDGYEIWDFKTYWNEETVGSTPEEPVYNLDTDGDGFPDSYEVFTLGTDPAVANTANYNSDGDNWTDLREYQEGTDPWLADSDFDGVIDSIDQAPRKTNENVNQTTVQQNINSSSIHMGLYDVEYQEDNANETVTYVENIYRGNRKEVYHNYEDIMLNVKNSYYYDENGNVTAIIESYDDNSTNALCCTYTYNADNKVIYMCDKNTRYQLEYDGDEITCVDIGNTERYSTEKDTVVDLQSVFSSLSIGALVLSEEETVEYANGQTILKKTNYYKEDQVQARKEISIYYNNDTDPQYLFKFDAMGCIYEVDDYTNGIANPTILSYNESTGIQGNPVSITC
ncbi:MAG: hypothetical protein K6G88_03045 [Lachnospiraceae bacterium]|nr:hypothetical protein [Lachnospiraceae bacterium]